MTELAAWDRSISRIVIPSLWRYLGWASLAALGGLLWVGIARGVNTGSWWFFESSDAAYLPYGDLRWIARWSECVQLNGFAASVDSCQIAYPLPAVWLFAALGFDQTNVSLTGHLVAVAWGMGATVFVLWTGIRLGPWRGAAIAGMLVAPPTWLLLERANLDAMIWLLVLAFAFLVLANRMALASVVLGAATLLKLYPVGGIAAFAPGVKNRKWLVLPLMALPSLAFLANLLAGLYVQERRPAPIGNAFGAFHVPYLVRALWTKIMGGNVDFIGVTQALPVTGQDLVLGLLAFLVLSGLAYLVWSQWHLALQSQSSVSLLSGTVGIVDFSYVSGANFDYRLTFLSFVVLALWLLSANVRGGQFGKSVVVIGISCAILPWLGTPWILPVQALGDIWVLIVLSALSGLVIHLTLDARLGALRIKARA